MAGGKGKINEHPNANTNGFDKNPGNIGNKRPSIKNQLKKLLEEEGKVKIDAKQVISINEDGSVVIKLPTQMQLAMKLHQWALSNKGGDSLKAIQMIMEQIDGKAQQSIDHTTDGEKINDTKTTINFK